MIRLGVCLDPLTTMRDAFGGRDPDLVAAVHDLRLGGADLVLVRATAAKRPITERDLRLLVEAGTLPIHLAIDPSPALVAWAIAAKPAAVVLPSPAGAAGGLDVEANSAAVEKALGDLRGAGLAVTLAVDPDENALVAATGVGAEIVEIHTGRFASAPTEDARVVALAAIARAAATAKTLGMRVSAGGELDEAGVERVASLEDVELVTVGRALVARAVFVGLRAATRTFVDRARGVAARVEEPAAS
jgi:pyridoxine 5-phosphate synthase